MRVDFAPDGEQLIVRADDGWLIFDARDGTCEFVKTDRHFYIGAPVVSDRTLTTAFIDARGKRDNASKTLGWIIWGQFVARLRPDPPDFMGIRRLDLDSGEVAVDRRKVTEVEFGSPAFAFSPDGRRFITGDGRVWDVPAAEWSASSTGPAW